LFLFTCSPISLLAPGRFCFLCLIDCILKSVLLLLIFIYDFAFLLSSLVSVIYLFFYSLLQVTLYYMRQFIFKGEVFFPFIGKHANNNLQGNGCFWLHMSVLQLRPDKHITLTTTVISLVNTCCMFWSYWPFLGITYIYLKLKIIMLILLSMYINSTWKRNIFGL
jgi:hypothetical protein